MPFSINTDHSGDIMVVTYSGTLDYATRTQALEAGHAFLAEHPCQYLLIDLRSATIVMSETEQFSFGEKISQTADYLNRPTAFVLNPQQSGNDFVENVALNRGYNFQTFVDYEQAVNWLRPTA